MAYTLGEILSGVVDKGAKSQPWMRNQDTEKGKEGLGQWKILEIFGVNIFGLQLDLVTAVLISKIFQK